jgi:hypothetical protein
MHASHCTRSPTSLDNKMTANSEKKNNTDEHLIVEDTGKCMVQGPCEQ